MKYLKFAGFAFAVSLCFFCGRKVLADEAPTLTPEITTSGSAVISNMTNGSYYSMATFMKDDTITITSDAGIKSLYICWNNKEIPTWNLTLTDGSVKECGINGYLHEYVVLDSVQTTITMTIPKDNMNICKIYAFGEGDKPSIVQDWSSPCDNADILLISTHADDEQIFFGGIIPYYAGELGLKVQVAYFTNYWNGSTIREHEKLDGLWTVGVRNYPVNGDFDDIYATSLEAAKTVYDYDAAVGFMTEIIRRFRPLVVVGQDINGEYGHGGHMLTSAAICDAVQISSDSTKYTDSADKYGTYDVPKTYLHLYPENQIDLDCRRQLNNFGGKTVLEVAAEGYLQHVSQQWCWFYVSDDYQYSCGRFGLYRTTVGNDTEADIMCNLTTYEEQERIAAEEASREAESESVSIAQSQSESLSIAESQSIEDEKTAKEKKKELTHTIIIVVILIVVAVILALIYLIIRNRNNHTVRRRRHIK